MTGKLLFCIDCSGEEEVAMEKTSCGPGLEVDRCPRCGGIWLDTGEMETLLKLGRFYIENLDQQTSFQKPISTTRLCPRCAIKLQPMIYERLKTIELDVCPRCGGIWCDTGELKLIGESNL